MLNAAWVIACAITLQGAPPTPAPSPWTDDRPITRMAQNLKSDLVTLPRVDTFAAVAAGLGGALIAHPADDNLSGWASRAGDSSYTTLGGVLGDAWSQSGAALGTYAIGKMTKNAVATHIGSDLIRAQLLNGVLTTGVKVAVGRTRPTGGSHAFPSGHSSATFASATVLADHFGWRIGVPAYAAAGFVGWSRVRDNQHWLSDVIFGSALGFAAGRTVVADHHHSSWTVLPAVTRNGAGLFVIKTSRRRE